ncbi:unnamed protein product, partial [Larinioides sclopetarius]
PTAHRISSRKNILVPNQLRVARLFGRHPIFVCLVGSVDEGKIHYATRVPPSVFREINTMALSCSSYTNNL